MVMNAGTVQYAHMNVTGTCDYHVALFDGIQTVVHQKGHVSRHKNVYFIKIVNVGIVHILGAGSEEVRSVNEGIFQP